MNETNTRFTVATKYDSLPPLDDSTTVARVCSPRYILLYPNGHEVWTFSEADAAEKMCAVLNGLVKETEVLQSGLEKMVALQDNNRLLTACSVIKGMLSNDRIVTACLGKEDVGILCQDAVTTADALLAELESTQKEK